MGSEKKRTQGNSAFVKVIPKSTDACRPDIESKPEFECLQAKGSTTHILVHRFEKQHQQPDRYGNVLGHLVTDK